MGIFEGYDRLSIRESRRFRITMSPFSSPWILMREGRNEAWSECSSRYPILALGIGIATGRVSAEVVHGIRDGIYRRCPCADKRTGEWFRHRNRSEPGIVKPYENLPRFYRSYVSFHHPPGAEERDNTQNHDGNLDFVDSDHRGSIEVGGECW
jgi:hypothetical protein